MSDEFSAGGFDLWHLFGLLLVAGLCAVVLYTLWECCSGNETPEDVASDKKVMVKHLYALELEPGLVVLQSQDGAYFRILQECDAANYGYERSGVSGNKADYLTGDPVTYVPHCSRTEVRNIPTAPPVSDQTVMTLYPPPYAQ